MLATVLQWNYIHSYNVIMENYETIFLLISHCKQRKYLKPNSNVIFPALGNNCLGRIMIVCDKYLHISFLVISTHSPVIYCYSHSPSTQLLRSLKPQQLQLLQTSRLPSATHLGRQLSCCHLLSRSLLTRNCSKYLPLRHS